MTSINNTHTYTGLASLLILCGAAALFANTAEAHEDKYHCAAVAESVENAGFADNVVVTCESGHATVTSNTYPDHAMMTGIVATNEQIPVPARKYAAPIPLQHQLSETPQTRDAALGIAVNGVPIYDYTGGGEMSQQDLHHHQTQHDTLLTHQLDVCGGHAGRGDDYHYHVKPVCMIEQMENAGDDAIIGWAFDGFPIYGDRNPDGTPIVMGALDVCNGQQDNTFGYRYHTSSNAPYIVQCLMGIVGDLRDLPRVAPLTPSAGSAGKKPGRPPRGGVENLVFTQNASGLNSMEYSYDGQEYYIRYTPSDTKDCYAFETRTITDNGETKSGEYCR